MWLSVLESRLSVMVAAFASIPSAVDVHHVVSRNRVDSHLVGSECAVFMNGGCLQEYVSDAVVSRADLIGVLLGGGFAPARAYFGSGGCARNVE